MSVRRSAVFGVLLLLWASSMFGVYLWCHHPDAPTQTLQKTITQTQQQSHKHQHKQQQQQQQHKAEQPESQAQLEPEPEASAPIPVRATWTSAAAFAFAFAFDPCASVVVPSSASSVLSYMRRAAPSVFDASGEVSTRYARSGPDRRWKIYYGFLYNREEAMLLTMLHTLSHVVDYFILVESAYTLTNKPKPLYLPLLLNRTDQPLAPFEKQLIYHVIKDPFPPDQFQYWEAEVMQRDTIGKIMSAQPNIGPDDLIVCTDVDEILDPRLLQFMKSYHILGVGQAVAARYRWTYFGYEWQNPTTWDRPCIISKATLDTGVSTNGIRFNQPNRIVLTVGDPSRSTWGGWHCSWCLPANLLEMKMKSYAHTELWAHYQSQKKPAAWFKETGTYFSGVRDTRLVEWSSFRVRGDWDEASDDDRNEANLAPIYAVCQKDQQWKWLFDPHTPQ